VARLRAEVEGGARAAERAAAEGGELRASLEAAKAAAAAEAAARAARSEWRLGGAMAGRHGLLRRHREARGCPD